MSDVLLPKALCLADSYYPLDQLQHSFHRMAFPVPPVGKRKQASCQYFYTILCVSWLGITIALRWLSMGLLLTLCLLLQLQVSQGRPQSALLSAAASVSAGSGLACCRSSVGTWCMSGSQERLRVGRSGLLKLKTIFKFIAATDKDWLMCSVQFSGGLWTSLYLGAWHS